jgi:putative hydrolase of the HAD superfamily
MSPQAISLDLDDTLWPIGPTILKAEQALDGWLAARAPQVRQAYPVESMRRLRTEAFELAREAGLAHDLHWVRRRQLTLAFDRAGGDPQLVEQAYEIFETARQAVEPFPDVRPALERLAARFPLAAVTNGSANLARIGLAGFFRVCITAAQHGAAKPDPGIFQAACQQLGTAPERVLHIGDDPALDVLAARNAGLQSAWINRAGVPWALTDERPVEYRSLAELVQAVA